MRVSPATSVGDLTQLQHALHLEPSLAGSVVDPRKVVQAVLTLQREDSLPALPALDYQPAPVCVCVCEQVQADVQQTRNRLALPGPAST